VKQKVIVAQRSRACSVCRLPPESVAVVNATIWPIPGEKIRGRNYRIDAVRACASFGLVLDAKTITRHASHVERSWHRVTAQQPAAPGEVPVFATDYQSMVGQAAQLGAHAIDRLKKRVADGALDDRDLIAAAKLGTSAVTQREALRMRAQEVDQQGAIVAALTGLTSGHIDMGDFPEVEVIDVTPVEVLHAEVSAEREALKRLASGEDGRAR
jgi:hypothetical protein